MKQQLPLYELAPAPATLAHLSRRSNPVSSTAAVRQLADSGALATQRARVLAGVQRWPGGTAAEIGKRLRLTRDVTSKRLHDLERAGLVRKGALRKCAVGVRVALEWHPAESAT